jgi:hypothetical protein
MASRLGKEGNRYMSIVLQTHDETMMLNLKRLVLAGHSDGEVILSAFLRLES